VADSGPSQCMLEFAGLFLVMIVRYCLKESQLPCNRGHENPKVYLVKFVEVHSPVSCEDVQHREVIKL
jgi:hypothetical protein